MNALVLLMVLTGSEAISAAQTPPAPAPVVTPVLKLPSTFKAKPGVYFKICADTNCKSVKWLVPDGLDAFPGNTDPLSQILVGQAGTYTLSAYGALGDQVTDIVSCTVTIATPAPPTPPVPPNPPPPTDPFSQAVQAAYTAETDAQKASEVAALASLYKTAATTTVNDTTLATLGDLFQVMQTASAGLLPATAIPGVRKVIGTEITAALGTTATTPLDAAMRAKAGAEFSKIATALGAVK